MFVSFDSETTGISPFHGSRPFIVSFTTDEGETTLYEWPVDVHTREVDIDESDAQEIRELLLDPETTPVTHNGIFDFGMLVGAGILTTQEAIEVLRKSHDTLLMSHAFDSSEKHNLKALCKKYLDIDDEDERELEKAVKDSQKLAKRLGIDLQKSFYKCNPSQKLMLWKANIFLPGNLLRYADPRKDWPGHLGKGVTLDLLDEARNRGWETVAPIYAKQDTERTLGLFYFYAEAFNGPYVNSGIDFWASYERNRRLLPVTFEMQSNGIGFNAKEAYTRFVDYSNEASDLTNRIRLLTKNIITNPASSQQVGFWLHKLKKVPPVAFTDKTKKSDNPTPKVDTPSLEIMQERLSEDSLERQVVDNLIHLRKSSKAADYLESYLKCSIPSIFDEDGNHAITRGNGVSRIHPSFNLTGTATTRYSSSNPNAQNIATKDELNLRFCFVPSCNRVLYSLDYSNIELRIPAHIGQDAVLLESFNSGVSVHLMICQMLWPRLYKELGKGIKDRDEYRWTKNGDFAIIYGASERKADATYKQKGAYKKVKEMLSGLAKLSEEQQSFAEKHGYILTLGKYPLVVPEPHKAFNYYVQGSAGIFIKDAMWHIDRMILRDPDNEYPEYTSKHRKKGPTDIYTQEVTGRDKHIKLIMQVHDELVFECTPEGEKKIPKIAKIMEKVASDYGVPVPVSIERHTANWSEGESVKV